MLDFLSRNDAPFSAELWAEMDTAAVEAARRALVGRRFMPLYGPLGPGADAVHVDAPAKQEVLEDGLGVMQGRSIRPMPQLYEDFWLYWRDIEAARQGGQPLDLACVRRAAQQLAFHEDSMVFYGAKAAGVAGLTNVPGLRKKKRSDWSQGEGAYKDVSSAVAALLQDGILGSYMLVISMDLFVQLQRIQPGTGILESERIKQLVNDRMYVSAALQDGTALVLCAEPQYMDLAVGVDMRIAYTEAVDLNHHLRILETALPRIKEPKAIVLLQ